MSPNMKDHPCQSAFELYPKSFVSNFWRHFNSGRGESIEIGLVG